MFILDTNILSALMAPEQAPQVTAWVSDQPRSTLFTTAISHAEILAGIAVMPDGRKRDALRAAAGSMFEEEFQGRVLPFDSHAAEAYAEILAARRQAGRPIGPLDNLIAAIAASRKAAVVTRDLRGFEGCGLTLVNPWEAA